ncbi:MAG: hypothetical protein J5659_00410 [Clostridia bacterium]|nr:hypothetical protein [Clostridia bacterium]
MKKVFIILTTIFFIILIPFFVYGEESEYKDFYEYSGIKDIENSMNDDTKSLLETEGISIDDSRWVDNLKTENVFSHVFYFLESGMKIPVKCGASIIAVILIAAVFKYYRKDMSTNTATKLAVTLAVISTMASGIWSSISGAINVIKSSSSFMLSFVPAYMGILSVTGAPATAAASGGMILLSAEFTAAAAAFGQSAVIGAYLALSIGSAILPDGGRASIAETFKKAGMWAMSLCATVFLGVLGAKNAINSAADGMAIRSAKFILGTCVPVAGNALSGAVNTVSASLSVLKSSVGIYGVLALAVMLLPVLFELLIWRLVLLLTGGICEIFGCQEISKLLKSIDGVFALLLFAVLIVGATFIISLSTVVSAGRGM